MNDKLSLRQTFPVVGHTFKAQRRCRLLEAYTFGSDCVARAARVRGPDGLIVEASAMPLTLAPGDTVVIETEAANGTVVYPPSVTIEWI